MTTEIEAGIGHNSNETPSGKNVAAKHLQSIVERIERLDEARRSFSGDIKDVYSEAKSAGFDIKVLRQLIAIRKKQASEVEEMQTLLDVYRHALGMA